MCSFYRSDRFTIWTEERSAVGLSYQMEKLHDEAEICIGGADRRNHPRDSCHGSRGLAAPSGKRQCEHHARSPLYWRRGPFSRIRRPRCLGPLGHLLWTHGSLNSMTSSLSAAILNA